MPMAVRVRLHIETGFNGLYPERDQQISASISWIWDGGFYVTLSEP